MADDLQSPAIPPRRRRHSDVGQLHVLIPGMIGQQQAAHVFARPLGDQPATRIELAQLAIIGQRILHRAERCQGRAIQGLLAGRFHDLHQSLMALGRIGFKRQGALRRHPGELRLGGRQARGIGPGTQTRSGEARSFRAASRPRRTGIARGPPRRPVAGRPPEAATAPFPGARRPACPEARRRPLVRPGTGKKPRPTSCCPRYAPSRFPAARAPPPRSASSIGSRIARPSRTAWANNRLRAWSLSPGASGLTTGGDESAVQW